MVSPRFMQPSRYRAVDASRKQQQPFTADPHRELQDRQ